MDLSLPAEAWGLRSLWCSFGSQADPRSELTVAHHMHDAIPAARLAVLSGAGHVSNLQEPVQFDAQVRAFCLSFM